MTTLYDRKPTVDQPSHNVMTASSAMQYVDGTPASPALTEYFDPMNATAPGAASPPVDGNNARSHANDPHRHRHHPEISVQEPTPIYEQQDPSFPTARQYVIADPKQYPGEAGATSSRRSTTSTRSAASRRVALANNNNNNNQIVYPGEDDDDVVLGQGRADVNRSGTWARGAGTSGIREDGVSRHASLAERASMAAGHISAEKQAALTKAEKKDAKRLSKIVKAEGKAEDKQLKSALKELASLQSAQKKASSAESAATSAQNKAAKEEQRATAAYLEAKTRWERATANLKVCEERLALSRETAQKTTALLRRQAEEVDAMRERKATDDREREVKLANLKAGILSP